MARRSRKSADKSRGTDVLDVLRPPIRGNSNTKTTNMIRATLALALVAVAFSAPAPMTLTLIPEFAVNANLTHYEDPTPNGCQAGEIVVNVTGITGSFCSPCCSLPGSSCPTDLPAGATAAPAPHLCGEGVG